MEYLDKSILEILALQLSGIGIFAVLTEYDVPELNMSFFGEDPFAVKRDIIRSVLVRFFIGIAALGFLIQGASIALGPLLDRRLYSDTTYFILFLVGSVCCWPFTVAVSAVARRFAKQKRVANRDCSSKRDIRLD